MKQILIKPTHILETSASWIDLIFTNQRNTFMDSGVHSSLHEKCDHQINYFKLMSILHDMSRKFRITTDLRQTQLINCCFEILDWYYLFSGETVHEQVELFNKTSLNIFHNFIPNKIILCDDKNPWMNYEIKKLIKNRKSYLCVK